MDKILKKESYQLWLLFYVLSKEYNQTSNDGQYGALGHLILKKNRK